jgi:hypothetical protein
MSAQPGKYFLVPRGGGPSRVTSFVGSVFDGGVSVAAVVRQMCRGGILIS